MKRMIIFNSIYPTGLSNIYCASLDPNSCIDENSTGTSYYDDFLDPQRLQYLEKNKNLTGYIEYMTPLQYYEECAKIFNSSVDRLKQQRQSDTKSIDWLTDALESKRKFQLPYINYANAGQEGLHRMMVLGDAFGWTDQKYPVLVVKYVDESKEIIDEAYKILDRAVKESITYRYNVNNLPDYFIDQVQFELDKSDLDDQNPYTAILKYESADVYAITLEGFESDIEILAYKDDMRITDEPEKDFDLDDLDFDLDDLDFDNIDELLSL